MSTNEKDHMGKIFWAAYYLIKSNQAFKKFPLLIELEEGIKFMESYKNNKSVHEVIINIAEEIENKNLEKVACSNFVSFLCDGSTDSSTTEKELMYIIFFRSWHAWGTIEVFSLRNAMSQNSEGLMETFLKTFQSKGVSDVSGNKIYFASDSDTVHDFDFEDSGLRPTKTYDTRWISYCLNALHKFYKKFKVFVLHLENIIREATTKEKSTLKGVSQRVVSS